MPHQSTIYHYDEMKLERVERKNPDSSFDRLEVRLTEALGCYGDTIDFGLSTWQAENLAWAIFGALGVDPAEGRDE